MGSRCSRARARGHQEPAGIIGAGVPSGAPAFLSPKSATKIPPCKNYVTGRRCMGCQGELIGREQHPTVTKVPPAGSFCSLFLLFVPGPAASHNETRLPMMLSPWTLFGLPRAGSSPARVYWEVDVCSVPVIIQSRIHAKRVMAWNLKRSPLPQHSPQQQPCPTVSSALSRFRRPA